MRTRRRLTSTLAAVAFVVVVVPLLAAGQCGSDVEGVVVDKYESINTEDYKVCWTLVVRPSNAAIDDASQDVSLCLPTQGEWNDYEVGSSYP